MKLVKINNNKMNLIINKKEWLNIGKTALWGSDFANSFFQEPEEEKKAGQFLILKKDGTEYTYQSIGSNRTITKVVTPTTRPGPGGTSTSSPIYTIWKPEPPTNKSLYKAVNKDASPYDVIAWYHNDKKDTGAGNWSYIVTGDYDFTREGSDTKPNIETAWGTGDTPFGKSLNGEIFFRDKEEGEEEE